MAQNHPTQPFVGVVMNGTFGSRWGGRQPVPWAEGKRGPGSQLAALGHHRRVSGGSHGGQDDDRPAPPIGSMSRLRVWRPTPAMAPACFHSGISGWFSLSLGAWVPKNLARRSMEVWLRRRRRRFRFSDFRFEAAAATLSGTGSASPRPDRKSTLTRARLPITLIPATRLPITLIPERTSDASRVSRKG
jgi:hypothetical protein